MDQRSSEPAHIRVRGLTIGYGRQVIQRNLTFDVARGEIFVIMGGSGGGKSTLLRAMLGLIEPSAGEVCYGEKNFTRADPQGRAQILRRIGVLYQKGALWSSMTLAENITAVLEEYTELAPAQRDEIAHLKLALVGLAGFEHYYPSDISGGMQKRAGLARALALDPEMIFCDEPSAGLDPINSRRLDELLLALRDALGATLVVVTHELDSIFAIADDSVFLDSGTKTMIATGKPSVLLETSKDERVQRFLRRGAPVS